MTANRQWNTLLWVMNTSHIGGSTLWVLDALRSMPAWHHEVIFVHGDEEPAVGEALRAAGASLSHAPQLTRRMVEAIAPAAVILSNTDPKALDGEHPWAWLSGVWPVISVHHSPVWPWIPGAIADVFVSRFLYDCYDDLTRWMRRAYVIPPGIVTADFARIERPAAGGRCVIGRHSSGGVAKFPRALPEIVRAAGCPAVITGGADYYPDADPELFRFPPIGSVAPAELLREIDIFLYRSDTTETWCRAVTEAMAAGLPVVADARGGIAEQIEDGVTGFLCKTDEEMIDRLLLLKHNPALRLEMGLRARTEAMLRFDVRTWREELEPLLLHFAHRAVAEAAREGATA